MFLGGYEVFVVRGSVFDRVSRAVFGLGGKSQIGNEPS